MIDWLVTTISKIGLAMITAPIFTTLMSVIVGWFLSNRTINYQMKKQAEKEYNEKTINELKEKIVDYKIINNELKHNRIVFTKINNNIIDFNEEVEIYEIPSEIYVIYNQKWYMHQRNIMLSENDEFLGKINWVYYSIEQYIRLRFISLSFKDDFSCFLEQLDELIQILDMKINEFEIKMEKENKHVILK